MAKGGERSRGVVGTSSSCGGEPHGQPRCGDARGGGAGRPPLQLLGGATPPKVRTNDRCAGSNDAASYRRWQTLPLGLRNACCTIGTARARQGGGAYRGGWDGITEFCDDQRANVGCRRVLGIPERKMPRTTPSTLFYSAPQAPHLRVDGRLES